MSDAAPVSSSEARLPLQGHLALVTGGSRGIGEAIARGMVRAGARVVIASRKRANLEAAVERISPDAPDRVVPFVMHTGRVDEIGAHVDRLVETHGVPTILVNNAGIAKQSFLTEITEEDWDAVLDTNLKGVFTMAQATARAMIKAEKSLKDSSRGPLNLELKSRNVGGEVVANGRRPLPGDHYPCPPDPLRVITRHASMWLVLPVFQGW